MSKCIAVCLCVLFLYSPTDAQPVKYTNTTNAAGGTANIAGNNYEWSVGEMALVNTSTASNIVVTQGVLQPAQGTGDVKGYAGIMKNVSVFPVPSKSVVYLQYNFMEEGNLHYELMDMAGRMTLQKDIAVLPGSHKQEINLENLPNAGYMLHLVYRTSNHITTSASFKLEKIN